MFDLTDSDAPTVLCPSQPLRHGTSVTREATRLCLAHRISVLAYHQQVLERTTTKDDRHPGEIFSREFDSWRYALPSQVLWIRSLSILCDRMCEVLKRYAT